MKKIIYGITKGDWGGAQKYVFDLIASLPKDHYEASVVLGKGGLLKDKLQATGVTVHQLNSLIRDVAILGDLISLWKLIRLFRKEKPDIIHLNSSKMGFLGALAGRLAKVPKIIFTAHGWSFNEDRGQFQKKILRFLHWLTIKSTDAVIAVSEKTGRDVSVGNGQKIRTIRNGIGKIDFLPAEQAKEYFREKVPKKISDSLVWIGTVSELHRNKGLEYALEAVRLFNLSRSDIQRKAVFMIIGEGEERKKLEEKIKRSGLEDSVFLIGRLAEAEKYLKAFDIFTLTSITEALPYSLLEAGQSGRAIIASDVGGISEIIEDMMSGVLLRPKEPEEIRRAFDFLTTHPDKALVFGQKLQEKIERDFSLPDMINKTVSLYEQTF